MTTWTNRRMIKSRLDGKCYICGEVIPKGSKYLRAPGFIKVSQLCGKCVDVWNTEGGVIGKISRSLVKEMFKPEEQ